MKSFTKCLFGGAILSAGLAAGAQAQFDIQGGGSVYAYSRESGYGNNDSYNYFPIGPFSVGVYVQSPYHSPDAAAFSGAFAGPSEIGTSTWISGAGGWTWAIIQNCYLTVPQDVDIQIDWNWDGGSAYGVGFLWIEDLTNGLFVFQESGSGSGSAQFQLLAGIQYGLSGESHVTGETDASTFWSITIPSPGSAGLLALAGLTAARRRRTTPRNLTPHLVTADMA